MTDDFEANARRSLERAVEAHNGRAPHAPLRVGAVAPARDGAGVVLQLLVLRPCKCGAHVAAALFHGAAPAFAMHEARVFVEAVTPPEGDDDDDDEAGAERAPAHAG